MTSDRMRISYALFGMTIMLLVLGAVHVFSTYSVALESSDPSDKKLLVLQNVEVSLVVVGFLVGFLDVIIWYINLKMGFKG